jgi:serine/threonine protein kinase
MSVKYLDVISRRSAYGLIWRVLYKGERCVMKMIMMSSGCHYDKDKKVYKHADGSLMSDSDVTRVFGHNDVSPYYHKDFQHRRSMSDEGLSREVKQLMDLGQKGLAPKVYGFMYSEIYPIHYGCVLMSEVDGSLKDVYVKRDLSDKEQHLVLKLLETLHEQYGLLHGDLKPSNVGVYKDINGLIDRVCFLDCQKIRKWSKHDEVDRENRNFERHIAMNKIERKM